MDTETKEQLMRDDWRRRSSGGVDMKYIISLKRVETDTCMQLADGYMELDMISR